MFKNLLLWMWWGVNVYVRAVVFTLLMLMFFTIFSGGV